MASHFHQLRISDIRPETAECISMAFDIPEALKPVFAFTQGQHLTLRTVLEGEELRRNYSLCSSPLEGEWRIAIKRVPGGRFTNFAHQHLKVGDTLDVMPPAGRFFTPLEAGHAKHYVAFAAGSGITPIISIIKTTLMTEPNSHFTLVFGNRHKGTIIFKDALEALKDKYIHRFRIIHIFSRERTDAPIHHGRIDAAKAMQLCEKLIQLSNTDVFFICGPEDMIFTVKDFLLQTGVAPEKIHFELFTTSHTPALAATLHNTAVESSGPSSRITIRMDGTERSFDLPYQGQAILDAALQQGADLPYACKGGVCCTCKARLLKGEVKMDVHYGLEPDEIAAGYILTCQSHPLTAEVMVDYDG